MSARPVVIGGGPAGLTAAHELASRTGAAPVVLEATSRVGGISCTVEHAGNRIDIGGHRFFSQSDRVMRWWLDRLPLEATSDDQLHLRYRGRDRDLVADDGLDPHEHDQVMLVRERTSRILWRGELFDYPLSLSADTLRSLGLAHAAAAGLSYLHATARPVSPEQTLEDFMVNRFGRVLYGDFFEDYTEKVWGRHPRDIPPDWGAQRIRGLSISRALRHAIRGGDGLTGDAETSLIERFLYPKLGPGQMWETVAEEVADAGGSVLLGQRAVGIERSGDAVAAVVAQDTSTGERTRHPTDLVVSSMPLPALVAALDGPVPAEARSIAEGLPFRDFLTVGLLVDRLLLEPPPGEELVRDNWIYVQDPDVRLGRLQVFNNWSPWMVADPTTVWLGLEYFCDEGDTMWSLPDEQLVATGTRELARLGVVDPLGVIDGMVLRVPKAYPAYFGTYPRLDGLRRWLDGVDGLWCVGRNGQHRYNNQDHSMLTAMRAVDGLVAGQPVDLWDVNVEQTYLEERTRRAVAAR